MVERYPVDITKQLVGEIESMSDPSLLDDNLRCPKCSAPINLEASAATCASCHTPYDMREGVLMMLPAEPGDQTASAPLETKSREAYELRYQELQNAKRYNSAYKQKLSKRWSTIREFQLLKRLLGSQPRCGVLLDLPCGGGRLTPALAPFADGIIEADVALGQVLHSKASPVEGTNQFWMTASALNIPLRDNSVDGVVSCRLNHHLPDPDDRDQLVRELLRVSKRYVIMTYFEYYSIKNAIRRIRRPFNKKLPKMTMTRRRIAELAAEQNARVVAAPWLAILSSGHRYVMVVKNSI
jgi:SAM-dependent methyltransferase